jgi:hypothetical protein
MMSQSELECTPPEVSEAAKASIENLLPSSRTVNPVYTNRSDRGSDVIAKLNLGNINNKLSEVSESGLFQNPVLNNCTIASTEFRADLKFD